jgi:hypothetical protein
MWQRIIVSVLVVTVAAAIVMAFVETQGRAAAVAAEASMSTSEIAVQNAVALQATVPPNDASTAAQVRQQGQDADRGAAIQQELNQAVDNVGEAWSATGTIVELGVVGMTVALADGSQVYVELGPSFYWQAQGTLAADDVITIDGFYNGDQYHAATLTKADGATLVLRSETGQPLWSGGASHNGGTGSDAAQGSQGAGQVQIPPEDWVTLTATVATVNRNGLTIKTPDGGMMALSFGRSDFWRDQAVQFAAGDAIEVRGFWQDGQFQTGQVTKTATGERLLLRDPNGRPLWGGPGRQGGQGKGDQGHTAPTNG